jgi:hypothetical protein
MRQWFEEKLRPLKGAMKAWPWIGLAVLVVLCLGVRYEKDRFPSWLPDGAYFILLGISTALFTRALGGMGVFRDAIADVLGGDRWLDRRNDLDDLWKRVTRRIFLPGFREDAPDAKGLLDALNLTMNKVIHNPEQRVNYFRKRMRRRIEIGWADESKHIVQIEDFLECDVVPFDSRVGCQQDMIFIPTTGEKIDDYIIQLTFLEVNGYKQDVNKFKPVIEGNRARISIVLKDRPTHFLKRTMLYHQCIDDDPIFVVVAGRGVVWGLNATITVKAAGLRVNFEEVGLEGEFREVRADRAGNMERDTEAALLPEQGFQIVMATVAQPRAALTSPTAEVKG